MAETKTPKADITIKLDSIEGKLDTLIELVRGSNKTPRKTKAAALTEAEDVLKTLSPEAVSNAVAMAAAAVEEEKAKPPKKGPLQWNEFVTQYIKNQAAKGILIKRPNAMKNATVKQAYRNKYGLGPAPPKKNKETRKNKKVRVQAPNNAVAVTPGRSTPRVPLARPEPEPEPEFEEQENENINTTPSPRVNLNGPKENVRTKTPTPPPPQRQEGEGQSGQSLDYEDLGLDPETELITVRIGGNMYYMVPDDNGLYRRNNNGGLGPWVGYLTNNKKIRHTNGPEDA